VSAIETIGCDETVAHRSAEPSVEDDTADVSPAARRRAALGRWLARHSSGWRVTAYGVVLAAFFVQGSLVWADVGGPETAPLSASARAGQDLWRAGNCESCHQLYGMGGFLGPDLTNVARRRSTEEIDTMLSHGRGLMPNFGLPASDRAALEAFFRELDRTGQGSLVATAPAPLTASIQAVAAAGAPLSASASRGLAKMGTVGCGGCHQALRDGGTLGAPDLSRAVERRGVAGVRQVLRDGRRAMPRFGLSTGEIEDLSALLAWTGAHRRELAARKPVTAPPAPVPWFSYPERP
jgi:nitric oxide reductase subunit C